MPELTLREQHLERHRMQAAKAFAKHVITKESDRRWLIQEMHKDGKPDWTMAAEIIVLEGGALYVGGDIDHVVFAHGPSDPIARLRWMGECKDLAYYIRQKARIGTPRHQETVDEWSEAIAQQELKAKLAEFEEEEPGFSLSERFDEDEYEQALSAENRHSFIEHACSAFKDCDSWEFVGDMGAVLSPAVIYAHAALARLCVLLREREKEAGLAPDCARENAQRAYALVGHELRYRLGVKRIDFTDAPAAPVRVETADGAEWHGCLGHAAESLRKERAHA